MKRFKSIVLAALAAFLVVGAMPAQSASAESSSLSITPRKDYAIEAGTDVDDTLTIRNLDLANELTLYLQVIDFTYTDETGTPKLLLDQSLEPTTWSLKEYLTVPETATVEPGGSVTLDMNIAIPENLGAGSYYSAIIYSTSAPSGGNLGLAASGVTLAFVTVPGLVDENLELMKFGAYDPLASKYQFLNFSEPRVIAYTLKNDGNVFESPVGSIIVKGMFGQTYEVTNINPNQSRALIGQTRTFQSCIKLAAENVDFQGTKSEAAGCVSPGLWPGMYTASIDILYGQNGNPSKEITKTAVFWYLPLWFLIVFTILVLVLAFYIWRTIVWMRGGTFRIGVGPRVRTSKRRRR